MIVGDKSSPLLHTQLQASQLRTQTLAWILLTPSEDEKEYTWHQQQEWRRRTELQEEEKKTGGSPGRKTNTLGSVTRKCTVGPAHVDGFAAPVLRRGRPLHVHPW